MGKKRKIKAKLNAKESNAAVYYSKLCKESLEPIQNMSLVQMKWKSPRRWWDHENCLYGSHLENLSVTVTPPAGPPGRVIRRPSCQGTLSSRQPAKEERCEVSGCVRVQLSGRSSLCLILWEFCMYRSIVTMCLRSSITCCCTFKSNYSWLIWKKLVILI